MAVNILLVVILLICVLMAVNSFGRWFVIDRVVVAVEGVMKKVVIIKEEVMDETANNAKQYCMFPSA